MEQFLEMQGTTRPGTNHLELTACKSMARRLGGSLQAESTAAGLAMVVKLPLTW